MTLKKTIEGNAFPGGWQEGLHHQNTCWGNNAQGRTQTPTLRFFSKARPLSELSSFSITTHQLPARHTITASITQCLFQALKMTPFRKLGSNTGFKQTWASMFNVGSTQAKRNLKTKTTSQQLGANHHYDNNSVLPKQLAPPRVAFRSNFLSLTSLLSPRCEPLN